MVNTSRVSKPEAYPRIRTGGYEIWRMRKDSIYSYKLPSASRLGLNAHIIQLSELGNYTSLVECSLVPSCFNGHASIQQSRVAVTIKVPGFGPSRAIRCYAPRT